MTELSTETYILCNKTIIRGRNVLVQQNVRERNAQVKSPVTKPLGFETSRSETSGGRNVRGAKRPGPYYQGVKRPRPKYQGAKRPGLKRQGSKRPGPKISGGETTWNETSIYETSRFKKFGAKRPGRETYRRKDGQLLF